MALETPLTLIAYRCPLNVQPIKPRVKGPWLYRLPTTIVSVMGDQLPSELSKAKLARLALNLVSLSVAHHLNNVSVGVLEKTSHFTVFAQSRFPSWIKGDAHVRQISMQTIPIFYFYRQVIRRVGLWVRALHAGGVLSFPSSKTVDLPPSIPRQKPFCTTADFVPRHWSRRSNAGLR